MPIMLSPVQPVFSEAPCIFSPYRNDSYAIDIGILSLTNCTDIINITYSPCAPNDTVFVCGNNLAYTVLPTNWTGLCTIALLLPDIDIVNGNESLPIPSFDYISGRSRRAVQFLPLLATLGITAGMATGTAGMGIAVHKYTELSQLMAEDIQALSGTVRDLKDQLDSLAEVVLQNRRGLDFLMANQGGIYLALQEKCCFYANKSGIVRDKIKKKLQDNLEERRRKIMDNPFWNGLNGFLPYLLPFLGPLLGLLILLLLGPFLCNKVMAFIKQQIDAIKMQPLQVHYHRLAIEDEHITMTT
ncbi:syncytin-2-like isoform X1 [Nycticebus coucang]|uniref:syncytin-2-like isoform X1 n=1 Tax=Nycticebus coucang TaxID=9470 RepID=UPI00234CAB0D|nr:syncytin-2-like isoform X1 [Nycticebus coucang]XP_053409517.1 syncytin-2-like isoform X1 [Nycticebus coucang]